MFFCLLIRYKVHVKVIDHIAATASFLLFDREVMQLIHKAAYELLEQQVQVCFAFLIYRQSSFKVVKLIEKPKTIQQFF